jgi:hypothetical protein
MLSMQAASAAVYFSLWVTSLLCSWWLWLFGARIGDPPVKEAAYAAKQSNLLPAKPCTAELWRLLRANVCHVDRK